MNREKRGGTEEVLNEMTFDPSRCRGEEEITIFIGTNEDKDMKTVKEGEIIRDYIQREFNIPTRLIESIKVVKDKNRTLDIRRSFKENKVSNGTDIDIIGRGIGGSKKRARSTENKRKKELNQV